ncbi:MAG: DUF4142 domain-containing protein [Thermoanaerobaculia bacterium]
MLTTKRGPIRPFSYTTPQVPVRGGVSGYFFASAAFAFVFGAALFAQTVFEIPLAAFAKKAAAAGLAEVELGGAGVRKAADGRVRRFAARMVEDRSRANARLREAAEPDGIRLPTGPDLAQQKSLDALMAVDGQAFDRQFMDQVVRDQEAAVADFEKAAGVDGECRVKALVPRAFLGTPRAF